MGGGTGRLPGLGVAGTLNGISPCMLVYVSYLSHPRLYGNNFVRPGKAGQFLTCKHSVPLCRDDIMLTLQIVPR